MRSQRSLVSSRTISRARDRVHRVQLRRSDSRASRSAAGARLCHRSRVADSISCCAGRRARRRACCRRIIGRYEPNVRQYPYDPARAEQLLDAAGFPRGADGVRFHLTMKTSTEESARLVGRGAGRQWRRVGVVLDLRPLEIATFLSDIGRGSFQLYTLRWVGANNDPDIFDYVFNSKRMPPPGANRGHYRNPALDTLIEQAESGNGSREAESDSLADSEDRGGGRAVYQFVVRRQRVRPPDARDGNHACAVGRIRFSRYGVDSVGRAARISRRYSLVVVP